MTWGSPVEVERRNRIRLTVAAYAYEMQNDPIMSDAEFDALAEKIEPSVDTGYPMLDWFFWERFAPYTGQWIYQHPELHLVAKVYSRIRRKDLRI